jgi:hypothetical protein
LVAGALDFCRQCGYLSVFLWTLGHLEAALKLYRGFGFRFAEGHEHRIWGQDLVEEKYILDFPAPGGNRL